MNLLHPIFLESLPETKVENKAPTLATVMIADVPVCEKENFASRGTKKTEKEVMAIPTPYNITNQEPKTINQQ